MLSTNFLATFVLFVIIIRGQVVLSTSSKKTSLFNEPLRFFEMSNLRKGYSLEKLSSNFLSEAPILAWSLESTVTLDTNKSSSPTNIPTMQTTTNPSLISTNFPSLSPEKTSLNPITPTVLPTIYSTLLPRLEMSVNFTRAPCTTPTAFYTYLNNSPPTQQPTYPEVDLPDYYNWYYVGINSHTFEVAYIVYLALFGAYSIYCCCCTGRWSQEEKTKLKYYSSIIFALYWVLFETILLCARMNHLLHLPTGTYRPRFTTGNTMVWLGPEYFTAGPHTRQNAGCPSETDIGHYASYDVCTFLFSPLNAEIMVEGAVKFSVGLGIGLYFLTRVVIATIDATMEWKRAEDPDPMPLYQIRIISFLIKMTFGCLQAVVLLPVQALQMNPYCAYIETPMSQKQSMCVFKRTSVGVTYGLPIYTIAWMIFVFANEENIISKFFRYSGCVLSICAVGLFAIFFFASIPLGIWFEFAAIGNGYLLEGSLLLNFLASSGAYLPAIIQALQNLVMIRRPLLQELEIGPV